MNPRTGLEHEVPKRKIPALAVNEKVVVHPAV
jgi:hypothetical protein